MPNLLDDQIIQQIREAFDGLKEPVHILFFGQKQDCEYCSDTRQLLEEVVAISPKLSLSIHDVQADADLARQYNVDKAPVLVVTAKNGDEIVDYGVRFAGIPAGHEFTTLIHDILLVSGRDSGLGQQTRNFLKGLTKPVHLQVFVTPTCPYCPRAVVLAHSMAIESPMVQAEAVEATEFPDLANKFHVHGVPQTTLNHGAGTVVGAVPEANLLAEIQRLVAA